MALKLCTPKKAFRTNNFQVLFLLKPLPPSTPQTPVLTFWLSHPRLPSFPPLVGLVYQTLSCSGHSLPFLEFYGRRFQAVPPTRSDLASTQASTTSGSPPPDKSSLHSALPSFFLSSWDHAPQPWVLFSAFASIPMPLCLLMPRHPPAH